MELERLRATTVTQAKIAKESAQEKADADLYTKTKQADAQKYNQTAEAQAVYFRNTQDTDAANYKRMKDAEAMLEARTKEAEAMYLMKAREAEALYLQKGKEAEAAFIARKKEADGLTEMAKAYGQLSDVMGGPQGLMQFLMLQNGTYERLAAENAKAIYGLQPKINVWTTGNESADASMAPIQNLFKSLPPLFSTIQDQTGMTPPSWTANMPASKDVDNKVAKVDRRQEIKTNGVNGMH